MKYEKAESQIKGNNGIEEPERNSPTERKNAYFSLFEETFPKSKIDILSGDLMFFDDKQDRWVSAFNSEIIEYLKSIAIDEELKIGAVRPYLTRYLREKREREGRNLLLDIPAWDGDDAIGNLTRKIHSPVFSNEQIDQLFKEWFARMFQRLENPEVDNSCIILLGAQGIGKDVFIKAVTSGLGQFVIPFQVQSQQKDMLQALHSGVAVHIEEFDHIAEKLPEAFLKMLITTSQTLFRKAYGRSQELREARWSLIASCNRDDFLRDHTGNRRFVIIPVDRIDGVRNEAGQTIMYPDGLIDYPESEGFKILAQAKALASQRYQAPVETKAAVKAHVEKLTPLNRENEFVKDVIDYVGSIVDQLQKVKGCYFLPTAEHRQNLQELAIHYSIKKDWAEIKALLAKSGMNPDHRTSTGRGIGVPPELLGQQPSSDTEEEDITQLLNRLAEQHEG